MISAVLLLSPARAEVGWLKLTVLGENGEKDAILGTSIYIGLLPSNKIIHREIGPESNVITFRLGLGQSYSLSAQPTVDAGAEFRVGGIEVKMQQRHQEAELRLPTGKIELRLPTEFVLEALDKKPPTFGGMRTHLHRYRGGEIDPYYRNIAFFRNDEDVQVTKADLFYISAGDYRLRFLDMEDRSDSPRAHHEFSFTLNDDDLAKGSKTLTEADLVESSAAGEAPEP
ncbi:MAG: hypothetical protein AAGK14_07385 [Verrucomicrobiota bacterium]